MAFLLNTHDPRLIMRKTYYIFQQKAILQNTWPICLTAPATAKSLQSCPTLCDPIDGSPPGSPVPGILQARALEWVATSFSTAWKWKVRVKSLSHVWLFETPWTAAYQAPLSMGLYRQEYWSELPLPSLDLYALKLSKSSKKKKKIWGSARVKRSLGTYDK